MRAVMCKDWGTPETLVVEDVPIPEPGPGKVRIAVKAAGVNFADTLLIQGKYQIKPDHPFSPGLESAGVIDAVGDGVSRLKAGDRVMSYANFGSHAEFQVVPEAAVHIIPDSMDFEAAAGFPVAYGTSHVGLDHRGRLQAGETLLVHGAAGGVGLTAVEIGKAMGATVIATARGAEKLAIAKKHGADHLVDYSEEDIRARVLEITGGNGANVIYDPVGGDVFDASLRCIAWEGRLLVIGFAAGRIPEARANYLLLKNCAAIGVFWGAYTEHDPQVIHRSWDALLGWYEAGKLKPHVSHTFALHEVPDAMKMLLSRKSTGKIVIKVA